ncbi:chloride channel protein [Arenibaculum pallidiluteum]|uniref:chloride channel protein n=1 Tax=Arenibaculum pallidiluteum TaxID=2812559 RepID=UPI001A96C7D8|nr:chloride channel protein [Arenibaculum pallidiluteum]
MQQDSPTLDRAPEGTPDGTVDGRRPTAEGVRLVRTLRQRARAALRGLTRKHARNNEILVVGLAALVGCVVGLVVTLLHEVVQWMHELLFLIEGGAHLSQGVDLTPWHVVAVPAVGGLVVGLAIHWVRRIRPREVIDPIEANALYGGRMSLTDSLRLTASTMLSTGCGASVGMEAAYAQLGAGLASKAGKLTGLRRSDLRLLVGCGAGAALAAAFHAPFAGAFYAFELVIGTYAASNLGPVLVASLAATFVAQIGTGSEPIFSVASSIALERHDYVFFMLLGALAAALGVAVMRTVAAIERQAARLPLPRWIRPAIGGLVVGLVALAYPQVLGSGQGAIQTTIDVGLPLELLLALLAAKAVASAVSVGAGFRGGLFGSSLFLGALLGGAFAGVVDWVAPSLALDRVATVLVGMGAMAAAVIGAPVTMTLLVLELTGDFSATVGVLVAVVTASFAVRQTFGYSFSTWRFHIRGVPIRDASDIGWIRDLTVGSLMRKDVQTAPEDLPLADLRARYPLGGTKHVFLVDAEGNYAGIVAMTEAHSPDLDAKLDELRACDIRHGPTQYLLPGQNVRTALNRFVSAEMETLAVIPATGVRKPIGYLTEAYALRRYNQELERNRAAELGDSALFGPS